MSESVLNELRAMMDQTMLRDRPRLRRMLSSVSQPSVTEAAPRRGRSPVTLDDVTSRILSSIDAVEARVSARPTVTFPANLPVVAQREAIMDMIAAHQVCVICGETGSGKTTQIPKMCIELGRGTKALIGHTQPRRIAARSVSGRIASELGQPLGASIGFKVRFSEEVSAKSLVKVMTDGILVAEIRRDRELLNYDTIIVDEAHERSLNIDFILGYLKRLLPSRPDLKVIVTSATLDAERIAAHFGGAPILNVSGRAYPVEIRYQPLPEEDESGERDTDVRMHSALCDALREATAIGPGDVLVFLSGEREIRDTAELLRKDPAFDVDILPLYARLNISDQQRVFGRGAKKRRVVLATNVAETSLTVPGIRFVIDPGRARISRYSYRTKVQRLPVEPISQASANQRAGRCGRVGPGVCFRLYSQEDFEGREPFTMPEIQRTNLASVILQMAAAKLGQMSDFPFVDAPDHRFVRDGQQLLRDLGATDERDRLTALGTKLARLPLDPQIGRMILASGEFECSAEILVIAAALSVGDPRDRSIERREAAAQAQEEFSDSRSDFVTFLNLWKFYQEQAKAVSRSQLRRVCSEHFLLPGRMREWGEVYRQLAITARDVGIRAQSEPATYGRVHRALLSGLLTFVGQRGEGREYRGMRGGPFLLSKGSKVSPRGARWLVAAELVETSRLFAHTAARVRPEWVERAAGELVRRTYFDLHWDAKRGEVMAFERVTLRGLTLIPKRRLRYEPIDPPDARAHFILNALVGRALDTNVPFRKHNDELIARVRNVEQKVRRLGLVVDDAQIVDFYEARLPAGIANRRSFERWCKESPEQASRLEMTLDDLLRDDAQPWLQSVDDAFPDDLMVGGFALRLSYEFQPTSDTDGVTAHVPLPVLSQLNAEHFDWTVPGLLREKVIALIRTLPKALRKNLVPVPDVTDMLLAVLDPAHGSLLSALEHAISDRFGLIVPKDAWRAQTLPAHLAMGVAISHREKVVEHGRDFGSLQYKYAVEAEASFRELARGQFEQFGLTSWSFGEFPTFVDADYGGLQVRGYPGLEDRGSSVALRLFETAQKASVITRHGLRKLFFLQLSRAAKACVEAQPALEATTLNYFFVPENTELAPTAATLERGTELRRALMNCALDAVFVQPAPAQWDKCVFDARLARAAATFEEPVAKVLGTVAEILGQFRAVRDLRAEREHAKFAVSLADVDEQMALLVYRGFVEQVGLDDLAQIPRYLRAIYRRLEKLPQSLGRDEKMMHSIRPIWQTYWRSVYESKDAVPGEHAHRDNFRWMLEELRVSAFAQEVGTRYSVSVRRCEDAWRERGGGGKAPTLAGPCPDSL